MFGLDETWVLDSRLDADTFLIWSDDNWQTRLMNDRRWPWIIVVPIKAGAVEIEDLHRGGMDPLMNHLADISKTLKAMGAASGTNVATLGNVVSQLHWHVVGRRKDDPNWPGPVWGFGEREPYGPNETQKFIEEFKATWNKIVPITARI